MNDERTRGRGDEGRESAAGEFEAWRTESLADVLWELEEFGRAARVGAERCFPQRIRAAISREVRAGVFAWLFGGNARTAAGGQNGDGNGENGGQP